MDALAGPVASCPISAGKAARRQGRNCEQSAAAGACDPRCATASRAQRRRAASADIWTVACKAIPRGWQAACRLGEADNPGPAERSTFLVANLTSASSSWEIVRDLDWSVGLFQETRQEAQGCARGDARRRGWKVISGGAETEGRDLVWIVIRSGAVTPDPVVVGPRVAAAVWSPGGPSTFRLYTVYGKADDSAEAQAETTEMVRVCLADSEAHGQVPALIAGDFNLTAECLGCAAELALGGWCDLGHEDTCATAQSERPRRIDLLLGNRAFQHRTAAITTDWCTGLAAHAAQYISVITEKPPMTRLWLAARLPVGEPIVLGKDAAWKAAEGACRREPADLDDHFSLLEELLERYYNARHGTQHKLRDRNGKVIWGRREPKQFEGTAETAELSKLGRRARRLRELARVWPVHGPPSYNAFCILEAVRRCEAPGTVWKTAALWAATSQGMEALALLAELEYEAGRQRCCEARRRRWEEWCRRTIQSQPGRVWGWVRQGPKEVVMAPAVQLDASDKRAQETVLVEAVSAWWWKLWRAPDGPNWAEGVAYLDVYDDFTPFPAPETWSGARVARLVKAMANKAPGADGRVAAELKDLAPSLHEKLAEFLTCVERQGKWPERLRQALVAMLPKRGTGELGDFRPITLLSAVYRLWAKGHSAQVRHWLQRNGVLRQQDLVGADTQAYELALRMAWARTTGEALSGVAIDWTKCYDKVALDVLPRVAEAARLPAAIWRPMYSMYTATRSVLLNGSVGEAALPTHGITAGCPLAGEMLALVAHMLVAKLRDISPRVFPRPYVDDLTTAIIGTAGAAQLVQRTWQVVGDFGRVFKWVTATGKCARYSTDKRVRDALDACEGPRTQDVFIDLGVAQHTTQRRVLDLLDERERRALHKMSRSQALRLDFWWRCRMVSGSGVPTALYGIESTPFSQERLASLRCAAFWAIWRGGAKAAREIVMTVLVPWRADPLTVALVRPVTQLQKALTCGIVSMGQLDEMLERPERVGPIASLCEALSRAGASYQGGGRLGLNCGRIDLGSIPPRQLTLKLVDHFRGMQMATLAKRRKRFRGLELGVDVPLTLQYYRSGRRKPQREASLRALQAGAAVVQVDLAERVRGAPKRCRHCGAAEETTEHRLHECPAWTAVRVANLEGHRWRDVLQHIPAGCWLTGVVPRNPHLQHLLAEAESAASWPASLQLPRRVWTDGSAIGMEDPVTARAGWAVIGLIEDEYVVLASGRVPGRQTSGRAELSALVWVSRCPGDCVMVTDNKSVMNGARQCAPSAPRDLCDGVNGDLWRLVQRRVETEWIKSHLDEEEVVSRGFALEDWRGNVAADREAGRQAALGALPTLVATQREKAFKAMQVYQRVIAAVQDAAMQAGPKRGRKGVWRRRHLPSFARRRRLGGRVQCEPRPCGPRPIFIHDIQIHQGPAPRPLPSSGRRGPPHLTWGASCSQCRTSAASTRQWCKLTRTLCPAAMEAMAIQQAHTTHELERVDGGWRRGWRCKVCGLVGSSRQRCLMRRSRCPVGTLHGIGEEQRDDANAWRAYHLGLMRCWRAWCAGRDDGAGLLPPDQRERRPLAPQEAHPRRPRGLADLRWRSHWTLTAGTRSLCVRCGLGPSVAAGRRLKGQPCPGQAPLKAAALIALCKGAFREGLAAANGTWRAKVRQDLAAAGASLRLEAPPV